MLYIYSQYPANLQICFEYTEYKTGHFPSKIADWSNQPKKMNDNGRFVPNIYYFCSLWAAFHGTYGLKYNAYKY